MSRIFSFVACSMLLAGAANADVLWGKAEYGATVEEVATAHPEGSVVPFDPASKAKLKNGAQLGYKINAVEIVGQPFEVGFYYLDGKLNQVNLYHSKPKTPVYACASTYTRIIEGLTSKYGTPLLNKGVNSHMRETSYSAGTLSVTANMFAFDLLDDCTISVAYNKRIAAAADKL